MKIPVYQPSLGAAERLNVQECLNEGWVSSKGKFIKLFEEKFSDYLGVKYSISVSNGTVALHLALLALGIKPGDEVIVPTFTYIASVNAIYYCGATPVFVDSCLDTMQIDVSAIEPVITEKTKAIMAVHLYGHPCDMGALNAIAQRHNLFLIEDAAEALGSEYFDKKIGAIGDVSTFSFYGNKTITTGEGGMLCTNNEDIYQLGIRLRGQGLSPQREYWHDIVGYNYRMTNICAAIGVAQLESIKITLDKKRAIAELYKTQLEGLPIRILGEPDGCLSSYWMVTGILQTEDLRDGVRAKLFENGIETRPCFYPVNTMPMYSDVTDGVFPVADFLSSRGLNLPSWADLPKEDIVTISELIRECLE